VCGCLLNTALEAVHDEAHEHRVLCVHAPLYHVVAVPVRHKLPDAFTQVIADQVVQAQSGGQRDELLHHAAPERLVGHAAKLPLCSPDELSAHVGSALVEQELDDVVADRAEAVLVQGRQEEGTEGER
jgi:hypothetical protein